ncbi:hypothetical protein F610DRAFT_00565 [Streptomyces sp. LaPpAH-199]|nr:hypothetical protein [Streptomyces sp. SID8369]NEC40225.1 hypothetical protein [Streptomyces sp. SID8016]SDB93506.1 hypothetical protein F610DRAFT_00565 [Streptomyces sp. LaPpAH-199]
MRTWRDGDGTLTVGTDSGGGDAAPAGGAGEVPLRIAASYRARTRGLLGRDGIAGALMLTPCGSVHTFGMRFAIDVAYLDRRFRVLAVTTMRPGRLGLPRLRARHVLEAEAGAMERWGVRRGVRVELTPAQAPAAGAPEATGTVEAAGAPEATGAAEAAGAPGASGAAGASGAHGAPGTTEASGASGTSGAA